MYIVDFCRTPKGLYLGWVVVNNGHYFGSGRTIDQMYRNVRGTYHTAKKDSLGATVLATKPTETRLAPIQYLNRKMKTRVWDGVADDKTTPILQEISAPEPQYDFHMSKIIDGKLVVYGVVKIAEYDNLISSEKEDEQC